MSRASATVSKKKGGIHIDREPGRNGTERGCELVRPVSRWETDPVINKHIRVECHSTLLISIEHRSRSHESWKRKKKKNGKKREEEKKRKKRCYSLNYRSSRFYIRRYRVGCRCSILGLVFSYLKGEPTGNTDNAARFDSSPSLFID